MAIQYTGAQIATTFTTTTGTRREVVDGFVAALASAGWSYSSGSGTGDVKMLSATTPQGTQTIIRAYDPGSGNCAKLFLFNSTSTLSQTGGCFILPGAGKVFQVIANPYQFFLFRTGSTTAREFACGGTPWLPSWNSGITECGWLMGNARTDTDTTALNTFRVAPTMDANNACANGAAYTNASLWEANNTSFSKAYTRGEIQLMSLAAGKFQNTDASTTVMMRWYDGSSQVYEPVIGWAASSPGTTDAVGIGQLWDAAMMAEPFAMDTTTTFDSHNWINIMHNANGTNAIYPRCSLWLVTP